MTRPPLAAAGDEDLTARARAGCAESFDELMRRYQTPLLHFLRLRGSSADAEDLLQETFLRAYENLHRYSPQWPFRTWIFTIARRVQLNARRRRTVVTGQSRIEETASTAQDPHEMLEADSDRRRLWSIAARVLSKTETTALWLYYVEEMSIAEIGNVVGRSASATKTMLFRARKRLAPFLKPLVDGDNETLPARTNRPPTICMSVYPTR